MIVHISETSGAQQLGSDGGGLDNGEDKSDFIQDRMLLAHVQLMELGARVWLGSSSYPSSGFVSF